MTNKRKRREHKRRLKEEGPFYLGDLFTEKDKTLFKPGETLFTKKDYDTLNIKKKGKK